MIVGRGNIAKAIHDREGFIFFASGVSDSSCTDASEFHREKRLLSTYWHEDIRDCMVYFSSIAVNFSVTPYLAHKLHMEECVKKWFDNYAIIRIGNVSWDTNPNTFLNHIMMRQKLGLDVEIRDEYRYMLELSTFQMVLDGLPKTGKHELTITSHIKKVCDYI